MTRARFPRGVRSTHYRKGTVLWHGTNAETGFMVPRGPAWFSNSREVARWFSQWRLGSSWDGKLPVQARREVPRILKFVVETPFSLPTIRGDGRDGMGTFAAFCAAITGDERLHDGGDMDDYVDAVCHAGFDGWCIEMNYATGDDIMLCRPERFLVRVPARGDWKP